MLLWDIDISRIILIMYLLEMFRQTFSEYRWNRYQVMCQCRLQAYFLLIPELPAGASTPDQTITCSTFHPGSIRHSWLGTRRPTCNYQISLSRGNIFLNLQDCGGKNSFFFFFGALPVNKTWGRVSSDNCSV